MKKHSTHNFVVRTLTYAGLTMGAAAFIVPFCYMVSSSLKDLQTIFEYPPTLIPRETLSIERQGRHFKVADYRPEGTDKAERVVIVSQRPNELLVEPYDPASPMIETRWVPEDDVTVAKQVRLRWSNYADAWTSKPFTRFAFNTVFITVFCILGQVLSASLVAFAFARLVFPGRNLLFLIVLATMMLPYEVTLIPNYLIYRQLGWIDTFLPLIVPSFLGGGAFNIFLFRQFFLTIPREMDEAARVDGCSSFNIYRLILMPLCKPVVATVAVFTFVAQWNDFLSPMIYLNSTDNFTLAIGLRMFQGAYQTDLHLLMAAATVVLLPVVVVFLLGQRYFVKSIVLSGTKG
jgi:multiple sugar transport system permease protein